MQVSIIFVEKSPFDPASPSWTPADGTAIVNANHWYDGVVLVGKHFDPNATVNMATGARIVGVDAVFNSFLAQIEPIQQQSRDQLGGSPTLIGETGVPFDLDGGQAYKTGDFSGPRQALTSYLAAFDWLLLSYTLWNYTPDNDNQHGDQWNGEDLSIFSLSQQTNPLDINSGGRALEAVARPYAMATAGKPLRMSFDPATKVFEYEYEADPMVTAPTIIFVPDFQYHGQPCVTFEKQSATGPGPVSPAVQDSRLEISGGLSGKVTIRLTP